MTRYIGCETARDLLDAFVDGELTVADQVMVEAHLRWCTSCAARVEDLSLIGGVLRETSHAAQQSVADERMFAVMQDEVLTRFVAEQDDSLVVRAQELFADMRLFWPALGATAAVFICLCGVFTVLQATAAEQPDSLAAMITSMSDPGSDRNPLRLDGTVAVPRTLDNSPMLDAFEEDEALYTFATVVTTEGRISNYALLASDRTTRASRGRARRDDKEVADLLHAVKESRFAPAQAMTGRIVAVNMVWMIARTTVKGTAEDAVERIELTPVRVPTKPAAPKPTVADAEQPAGVVRSGLPLDLPTA